MKDFENTLYRSAIIIMSIVVIFSLYKILDTYLFSLNPDGAEDFCKQVENLIYSTKVENENVNFCKRALQTSILTSATLILMQICILYTIIYVHSQLKIPFKALYLLICILFFTFPLFVSISVINASILEQSYNDYLSIYLPHAMSLLNICFVFMIIYLLLVYRTERMHFDKDFTKQSFVLMVFHAAGIFFTNANILLSKREFKFVLEHEDLLFWMFIWSITAIAVTLIYLFVAIASNLKINFQIGLN